MAGKLAKGAPRAQAAIKQVVASAADLPLEQALAQERAAFQALFDTADQKETRA